MKHVATSCLLFGLSVLFSVPRAQAQQVITTYPAGAATLTLSALTTGLDTPWELVWGPDNFLWMTERYGRISRINPGTGQLLPLLTIPDVTESGESGLLGMAIMPLVTAPPSNSAYVFVVYNYTNNGLKEKLVRYTYNGSTLGSPLILLDNITAAGIHSGSRLLLRPDNTILMTTGDAAVGSSAQNLQSLNGKTLRLNLDGTVPADNPTAGSYVYSYGHRNAQGLTQVPATGFIYSSEHGDSAEDELNLIESNRNYGWPTVEGFCNLPAEQAYCQANNVREPLANWAPTIATAGLAYYNHPAIPAWSNSLLLVSLKAGRLIRIQLSATGTAVTQQNNVWSGTYGRMRAICVSPQGRVYLATSNRDGRGNPATTDDRVFVLENLAYAPNATRPTTQAMGIDVYPNPAQTAVTLRLAAPLAASATVTLADALGRVVRRQVLAPGQSAATLPVSALSPGVYTAQIASNEVLATRKVIVE